MENKIITALRFASARLAQAEKRIKALILKGELTTSEGVELASLSKSRARIIKSCGVNDLYEICDTVDAIIRNYGVMKGRGKKLFTVRLVVHETFEDT